MAVERNPFQVLPGGLDTSGIEEETEIELEIEIDPEDGMIDLGMNEDTAVMIAGQEHYVNIADLLDEEELEEIGTKVIEQYEADKDSRQEWESTFERGFDLLGLKLQETTEPFEGACTAVSPLIIESAVKFQSKASMELFPAGGPVRAQVLGGNTPEKELQVTRVQNFMNYQLTEQVTEYFEEFERMLFHLPLVGSAFKKIYYDPGLERPCSEFVPVDQFYVSYNAPDLRRADRYTHVIYRSENDLRKEIASGLYRDVDIGQPGAPDPTVLGQKIDRIMGVSPSQEYDQQYVILEQHCYMDLPAPFNSNDGVAYPYIITVEENSGQVLAIRRNYEKDDPRHERQVFFAHYKFVPGFGFYGLGLIHLLGNLTMSATAALRSLVDAGQFANLPGGFKARGTRVVGGNDPISPGEFKEIEAVGNDLSKLIIPLPYKEPSQVLFQMLGFLSSAGQKFADTTEQIVGDATNYGPVGTTMALLEAGAKFFSAIHKRLHHSQKEEFRILSRINYEFLPDEYPYNIPGVDASVFKSDFDGRIDIIPVSDPNVPSAAHRLAMSQMVLQLATQAPPGMYNLQQVHLSILNAANIQSPERFLIPPTQPQPNDPITDIQLVSMGQPIKAFPQQDHPAHISVKTAFIEDPTLGQNPMMQSVIPVLQANIREHMVLQYAQQMAGLVGQEAENIQAQGGQVPPEILSQLTQQAAQQVLQANEMAAANGSMNSLEQQSIQLEAAGLALKKEELQIEATKDAADLSLKNRELDIKEMELHVSSAAKVGQREDRDADRKLKAVKDAGTMAIKESQSIREQNTRLAIESIRAMIKERDLMIKSHEERDTIREAKGMASGGTVDLAEGRSPEVEMLATEMGISYEDAKRLIESQLKRQESDNFIEQMISSLTGDSTTPTPVDTSGYGEVEGYSTETGEAMPPPSPTESMPQPLMDAERGSQPSGASPDLMTTGEIGMPEEGIDLPVERAAPAGTGVDLTAPSGTLGSAVGSVEIFPNKEERTVPTKSDIVKEEIMNMTETISEPVDTSGGSAMDLIKGFEGFEGKRYMDSAGVPTIGYGTAATSGMEIPESISKSAAHKLLETEVARISTGLDDALGDISISQGKKDALASLAYNVGLPAVLGSKGFKALKEGDIETAHAELFGEERGFVNAGGKKLPGLVNRRREEGKLFLA